MSCGGVWWCAEGWGRVEIFFCNLIFLFLGINFGDDNVSQCDKIGYPPFFSFRLNFFKTILNYVYACVSVCGYVHVRTGAEEAEVPDFPVGGVSGM